MANPGYVYILTNKPMGTLYIGATNDLPKRIEQHRAKAVSSFTKRFNCFELVWFERFENIEDARAFELRVKKWNRAWKVTRIVERNPRWLDLAREL